MTNPPSVPLPGGTISFQFLLFDGFDDLDVVGAFEPLRMAGAEVKLKTVSDQEEVRSIHGLRLQTDGIYEARSAPAVLLVPGGGWLIRAPQGAWAEAERGDILTLLRAAYAQGVTLASVCTGSLLLARAGLLDGRPATTNRSALLELRELKARVVEARVVDDGNIVTAGGVSSSLDLGIHLVERYFGSAAALEVSRRLEFEQRGPIMRAEFARPLSG
jgi:transcriptional regulator GlxA family with amidase domain